MRYALVKPDGSVEKYHDFDGQPPSINPAKGRWVQDTKPPYDPDKERLIVAEPVPGSATTLPYQVVPLSANELKRIAKMREVEAERSDVKTDAFTKLMLGMQPADWNNYVNANVTDPGARQMFRKMGRVLLLLLKKEFVND